MTDLETRLRSQLAAESDLLPPATADVASVVALGRSRRRRASVATSAAVLVLLAGSAAVLLPLVASLVERSETVYADQPVTGDPAGDPGRAVLEVDSTSTTLQPPTSAPEATPAAGEGANDAATPGSGRDDPGSTGSPSTGSAGDGALPTAGAMAEAVAALPAGSVLFHTDNEGCAGIENGQRHPDWVEGQPGSGRNEDGTPTYGFAYNTGDSVAGDLEWGIVEHPAARSGRCVVSMTLNRADTHSDAIRLFRRYDRNGDVFPADAYYSVWLYFPDDIVFDGSGAVGGEQAFGFWNVFQIKNDIARPDGGRESLSGISFSAGRLPDEPFMSLYAYSKVRCGTVDDCPEAHDIAQRDPVALPLGRWVHLEVELRSRPDDSGRLRVWQDGREILSFRGVTEREGTVRRTWSLAHMGQLHHTASHSLLADDPLISTVPIHPLLFD